MRSVKMLIPFSIAAFLTFNVVGALASDLVISECEPVVKKVVKPPSPSSMKWIKSDQVIYGIDDHGLLYEAHLGSMKKKPLLKIAEKGDHEFSISPNGEYLFYSVYNDHIGMSANYYLYERRTGKSRLLDGLPDMSYPRQLKLIGFSPDSKRIAWQDNRSMSARSSGARASLIVYSTDNLKRTEYAFPSPDNPTEITDSCFASQWDSGGKFIYSNFIYSRQRCTLPSEDQHNLHYFKTEVPSGIVTTIDGGYTYEVGTGKFHNFYLDGETRIDSNRLCNFSRDCGMAFKEVYAAGGNEAHIEGEYVGEQNLVVKNANQSERVLASGIGTYCYGSSIDIISWIDGGKYLLYSHEGNTYLYSPAENKTSVLPQLQGKFNWLPLDRTSATYTDGLGPSKEGEPATNYPSWLWQ